MSGNYYFYIVNRFDSLIYEQEIVKNVNNQEKKKDDTPYFYQFIAHASLDFLDEKLTAKSTGMFYANIDRFNEWSVSAFVTPSYLRFIVLHDAKNDDGIRNFCQEVYECYVKFLLNPFYTANEPIKSDSFDKKIMHLTKRLIEEIKEETKSIDDDTHDDACELNSRAQSKSKLNRSFDYVINFLVDKKLKYSAPKRDYFDLDLSNRQIVSIGSNTFHGLNLKRINLSSNRLTRLDAHLFDGLSHLKELNLASNRLSYLDPAAFRRLKVHKRNRVRTVLADVVHHKKKSSSSSLTRIDLQNNEIETLSGRTFADLSNLEHLNLKGNKMKFIEANLFHGVVNLNFIDISFNQISYLNANLFKELVNLKYLDLSRNQLKSLEANTFSNLKSLEVVNLSGNEIDSLDSDLFSGLFNLGIINLSHNKLKKLDDSNLFKDLHNLETLNLEFNSISSIGENTFNGLVNLKEVKLYHNNLASINENIFKGLSNLEYLYLSFNRINFIHWKALRDLKCLKTLHLSFNRLKAINSRLFKELASLNEVYLDHNYITRIERDTFRDLAYLSKLYLASNLIKHLDPHYLIKIKHIDLEENYLTHECQFLLTNSLKNCKLSLKKQKQSGLVDKLEKKIAKNKPDNKSVKLDKIIESSEHESADVNDQFYDASDALDTNDSKLDEKIKELDFRLDMPDLIPSKVVKHRLTDEIERIVREHLTTDLDEDFNTWELLARDGDMKIYRRDLEENGIVIDPLKAVHTVKGITAHEVCKYFFDEEVRLEWDLTVEKMKVVERLSSDTLIFHQVVKRVWPSAQRDTCFWSHIRPFNSSKSPEDESNIFSDWIVVNYSTAHELAPVKEDIVRAYANVAMICSTVLTNKSKLKNPSSIDRNDIMCKITYVSQLNPGGWVPAKALRAVYKSVYPKFVKSFSEYVISKTANRPILY